MPKAIKKRKVTKKTSAKSSVLIPQPHGGALSAGNPGNKGGTGRPRDAVREKLAGLAEGKGFAFLDKLMDGKVRFRLVGECAKCGEVGEPHTKGEQDALWDEIKASIDHRLKANDQILRFGVGTKDETDIQVTNHPEVQQFITRHAQATIEIVGQVTFDRIAARIVELEG